MSAAPAALGTTWLVPNYPWSGDLTSGIFYRNQATALARADVDVTVLAPTPWAPWPLPLIRDQWARYRSAPREQVDDGVTVLRPRYPAAPGDPRVLQPDRSIAAAAWSTRRRWTGARLVHGHFSLAGLAAQRLARRARLPYVLTMHGDDVNTWPHERPEWRAALTAALGGAAQVITVSAALADRVQELAGVVAMPLPLGIAIGAFRTAAGPIGTAGRAALGLPADAVVALFVGNLQAAKGIREFVDGVAAARGEVVGVVIGSGPEATTLATRGAGRVRWLGTLPNADVARHMAAADVLVLPSHGEGLPTVVVEAGAIGLPVIASRVGGIPELLGSDRGILLDEITSGAVAEALEVVAGDPGRAREMGSSLRAHVEADYDVDRNARRLIDVYREVASI